MMKYRRIPLWGCLILFSINMAAQEHLARTLSITAATPLNGKGFNLTLHYHLNSFDEFRGGAFFFEDRPSDTLRLATNLFSFDYVKGFKFKQEQLNRFGYYLGIGLFTGKEKPLPNNGELRPRQTIFGIRPFAELEWTAIPQFTLISRIGRNFSFSNKATTNLESVLGVRLYF